MAREPETNEVRREYAPPLVDDRRGEATERSMVDDDRMVAEAVPRRTTVVAPVTNTEVDMPRDRVRWGPVWAGFVTTMAVFLVLELLMFGFGWLTLDFSEVGGNGVGTTTNDFSGAGGAAWVSAFIAFVAFFAGGWVAQATSSVRGTDAGLMNGTMVWALGTTAIIIFSALGLGLAFGPVGTALANVSLIGQNQAFRSPADAADTFRDASLWSALFLIVAAGSAALGGWLGNAKPDDPIGHIENENS